MGHDPEVEEYEVKPPVEVKKPKSKKLPLMWSRVVSIAEDGDEDLGTYNIEYELEALLSLPKNLAPRRTADWTPIFQPTAYASAHPDLSTKAYRLGEKRLRTLGIEVSKLRALMRKAALHQAKAEAKEQERDLMEVSRLARSV